MGRLVKGQNQRTVIREVLHESDTCRCVMLSVSAFVLLVTKKQQQRCRSIGRGFQIYGSVDYKTEIYIN